MGFYSPLSCLFNVVGMKCKMEESHYYYSCLYVLLFVDYNNRGGFRRRFHRRRRGFHRRRKNVNSGVGSKSSGKILKDSKSIGIVKKRGGRRIEIKRE